MTIEFADSSEAPACLKIAMSAIGVPMARTLRAARPGTAHRSLGGGPSPAAIVGLTTAVVAGSPVLPSSGRTRRRRRTTTTTTAAPSATTTATTRTAADTELPTFAPGLAGAGIVSARALSQLPDRLLGRRGKRRVAGPDPNAGQ